MLPSMLIMVREGFEAALIVALVFTYLRRIGRLDMVKSTWTGVAAAVTVSALLGVVIHETVGSLAGRTRLVSFAAISLVAGGVLTWMVFWMRRQSRAIKRDLETRVDAALRGSRAGIAVAAVAFLAVLREGIEAALFLIAAATESAGRSVMTGAVVGVGVAALLGLLVYAGGRRIPMRAFFQVTGLIVIVFAAGLLARAVLFLQAAGLMGSINESVYDLTRHAFLTQQTEVGRFLAAMVGWDPRPSIEQVAVWLAYIVPVGWAFIRPTSRSAPRVLRSSAASVTDAPGQQQLEPTRAT